MIDKIFFLKKRIKIDIKIKLNQILRDKIENKNKNNDLK
jgi:hypothetical protein